MSGFSMSYTVDAEVEWAIFRRILMDDWSSGGILSFGVVLGINQIFVCLVLSNGKIPINLLVSPSKHKSIIQKVIYTRAFHMRVFKYIMH